jgi:hypothetical protein
MKSLQLPAQSHAFTCCQVPVCYEVADAFAITVEMPDGGTRSMPGARLGMIDSRAIFSRSGEIVRLRVQIPAGVLC